MVAAVEVDHGIGSIANNDGDKTSAKNPEEHWRLLRGETTGRKECFLEEWLTQPLKKPGPLERPGMRRFRSSAAYRAPSKNPLHLTHLHRAEKASKIHLGHNGRSFRPNNRIRYVLPVLPGRAARSVPEAGQAPGNTPQKLPSTGAGPWQPCA